jgi:hypothetical protein
MNTNLTSSPSIVLFRQLTSSDKLPSLRITILSSAILLLINSAGLYFFIASHRQLHYFFEAIEVLVVPVVIGLHTAVLAVALLSSLSATRHLNSDAFSLVRLTLISERDVNRGLLFAVLYHLRLGIALLVSLTPIAFVPIAAELIFDFGYFRGLETWLTVELVGVFEIVYSISLLIRVSAWFLLAIVVGIEQSIAKTEKRVSNPIVSTFWIMLFAWCVSSCGFCTSGYFTHQYLIDNVSQGDGITVGAVELVLRSIQNLAGTITPIVFLAVIAAPNLFSDTVVIRPD